MVHAKKKEIPSLAPPDIKRVFYPSFLIFLTLSILLSCSGSDRPERSVGEAEMADQEFADFTTIESDSGIVEWILDAPVARVYNIRKLLVTDSPEIVFYDRDGKVTSILTADKGEYNQQTHDLTALGNVVLTSTEGFILETESLVWLNQYGQIHTEDFVKVTKGNDILTGYGFQGYPELKNIDIKRDVKAYLRDEEGLVENEVDRERGNKAGKDE
ncbi:MAG: LPS export ABC transporter periplasmic protein LptC [Candidatus Krumholzibacteriota bacterium]|nr:LPS export ABC transporter periplasmic protein LptC [Candidatus Krumholzibacteriota bacterium]